jgi:hypothetical protein
VAVWDVTASPRWSPLKGSIVSGVECHYRKEPKLPGWHSELITLTIDEQKIYVFLGDVDTNKLPTPSTNSLMVMSAPTALPDWMTD